MKEPRTRILVVTLVLVLAPLAAGCPHGSDYVECRDDTSCDREGGGRCLKNPDTAHQFCAYPDVDCPQGFRWSDLDVEASISGRCVAETVYDAGVDAPIDATPPDAAVPPDADTGGPSVVAVTPNDAAPSVSTTTSITVEFSEPIAPSSVTTSSFQLTGPSGQVVGAFILNGPDVTFTPTVRLDPAVTYDVTVTTAIEDLAGNALAAQFTSSFTTRAGGWVDSALLEQDTNTQVTEYDAAMRHGHGVAIWAASTCAGTTCGAPYEVWAVTYEAGSWAATPELVATETSLTAITRPRVTIDAAGNVTAAWLQLSGSYNSVWSSHRPVGGPWTPPALIETEQLGHAANVRLSGDSSGNAFAVWEQNDGTSTNVWANRYSSTSGWGTAAKLEAAASTAFVPGVAANDDGTALAVWMQNSNVYFARYAGAVWTTAALVAGVTGGAGTSAPVIRVDSNGGNVVVWISGTDVKAARYNGAWTNISTIDSTTDAIMVPLALATSTNGKAIAIWAQGTAGNQSIHQSEFDGSTWNNEFLIEPFSGASSGPTIGFGVGDRAMAGFNQGTAALVGWSSEKRPALGWQPPESIITGLAGVILYDDQRNVFIDVWPQSVVGFASMYWSEYL